MQVQHSSQLDISSKKSLQRANVIVDEYPLTHGQQALWFLHQLTPESVAYNQAQLVGVRSDLNVKALQAAIQTLAKRHDVLRTTFKNVNGQPVQRVHDDMELGFEYEDAGCWSEKRLLARLKDATFRPFDLEHGPLLRITLLRKAQQQYLLHIVMHHIITDMWSYALILHELPAIYDSIVLGTPLDLKPPRSTYGQHVKAEAELLGGPKGEAMWKFWQEQLAGELPVLNLPTDRPRPAVRTDKGASSFLRINAALTEKLSALAKEHHTNLHNLLLAAFHTLLHRYSGQDDVIIGLPKANRTRSTARLIGYFVNSIPLRADLSPDKDGNSPTFAELLDQVKGTIDKCFANDAYPLPLLVEKLQPERTTSHSPIFQVAFAWQKTTRLIDPGTMTSFALGEEGTALQMGSLQFQSMPLPYRTSPFDVTLWMAEAGDELGATLEYSRDIFEPETADRMLKHYARMLEGIAENPACPIDALPMLTEAERKQIDEWSTTPSIDEPFRLTHEWIEAQVAETPDAPALVFDGQTMTYDELNRRANRLARTLIGSGVGPGVLVGLSLNRSAEMIVGLLGIMKAGGIYLPLDPTYPVERLRFMLADAGVTTLVTTSDIAPRFSDFRGHKVYLDADDAAPTQQLDTNPGMKITPGDPAYVIYTSGSTGQPKGVLLSHEAISRHSRDIMAYYHLTPQDGVLQFASINFDASLEQILPALMAGAKLVLRGDDVWTPAAFRQFIRDNELTVINLPPAYWHQVAEGWAATPDDVPADLLRLVIIGGDVLQPETLKLWWQTPMKKVRLLNAYGPTETTITATTFDVTAHGDGALNLRHMPIGSPTPGRRLYILDAHGQPVPAGVPGELTIGGECVALAYLYRPELTTERFVADPFNPEPGARMYKTGDLACWLPDGSVEFIGRLDHQVKVRGYRVELGEIEATLIQHPAVREAVVVTRKHGPDDKQLAAYVTAHQSANVTSGELREYLRAKLPAYMVPAAFIVLDELPLGPSGKLDRRMLPAPPNGSLRLESLVMPRSPLEEDIAVMWSEVLNVQIVGVHTNFFDLGGHSLLATQLIARIEEKFNVDLPVRSLFETPTVAGLAEAVTQLMASDEEDTELASLLLELDELSEEEVQRMLAD